MGFMKEYLMEKVAEYAEVIGVEEKAIYEDSFLYGLASLYAESKWAEENGRNPAEIYCNPPPPKRKRNRFAIWCCAWVDLAASVVEILCLGFVLTGWRLRAAKYFAGFRKP